MVGATDFADIRCPQRGQGIMKVGRPEGGAIGCAMKSITTETPHLPFLIRPLLLRESRTFCAAHAKMRQREGRRKSQLLFCASHLLQALTVFVGLFRIARANARRPAVVRPPRSRSGLADL